MQWLSNLKNLVYSPKEEKEPDNQLSNLVEQFAYSVDQVSFSAQKLRQIVTEGAKASGQIVRTAQEFTSQLESSTQQEESISSTTLQISAGVEEIAANAQSVANNAQQAFQSAESGNAELNKAVNQMDAISLTVDSSTQAMQLLGQRSQNIGAIVETITSIAGQTNLLALNTAIEAARTGAEVGQEVNREMEKHMLAVARLTARLLQHQQGIATADISSLAQDAGVEEIWITDSDGVVVLTNIFEGVGFRFSQEGQAGEFRAILGNPSLEVVQPPTKRDMDGRTFKYVGIARRDCPGIIQVGNAFKITNAEIAIGGFSVIAEEVRKLALESEKAAKDIAQLIRGMQGDTQKAIQTMQIGNQEVDKGIKAVKGAGQAFQEIRREVEEVSTQVKDISVALEDMAQGVNNLVQSINDIGQKSEQLPAASIVTAAQRQNTSLEEIVSSTEVLVELIARLQNQLKSRFLTRW